MKQEIAKRLGVIGDGMLYIIILYNMINIIYSVINSDIVGCIIPILLGVTMYFIIKIFKSHYKLK